MGKLARMRGKLFDVIAVAPIYLADGRLFVPAGTMGQAVIRWGGEQPGYFVEWAGCGACGVLASHEGGLWQRVSVPVEGHRVN